MNEKVWFYYVHKEDHVVARINTDAFDWRMEEIGFRRCSYAEYLKVRKSNRVSESEIDIEGKVKDEH